MSLALDEKVIEVVNVPQGHVLFKQGDKGAAAYVVNDGTMGIYREAHGRKIMLATIRKGELFGEMAVIDGSPRMATAFAISTCTLTVISGENIANRMKRVDPFVRTLMQMLLNNLRGVHDCYAPKSRSLADVVNLLARECDALAGFLQGECSDQFRATLAPKAKSLEVLVKDLRRIVVGHREEDKRTDALPTAPDQNADLEGAGRAQQR